MYTFDVTSQFEGIMIKPHHTREEREIGSVYIIMIKMGIIPETNYKKCVKLKGNDIYIYIYILYMYVHIISLQSRKTKWLICDDSSIAHVSSIQSSISAML